MRGKELIKKYINAGLTNDERFELEKLALDDDFLALAWEGLSSNRQISAKETLERLEQHFLGLSHPKMKPLYQKIWPYAVAASLALVVSVGILLSRHQTEASMALTLDTSFTDDDDLISETNNDQLTAVSNHLSSSKLSSPSMSDQKNGKEGDELKSSLPKAKDNEHNVGTNKANGTTQQVTEPSYNTPLEMVDHNNDQLVQRIASVQDNVTPDIEEASTTRHVTDDVLEKPQLIQTKKINALSEVTSSNDRYDQPAISNKSISESDYAVKGVPRDELLSKVEIKESEPISNQTMSIISIAVEDEEIFSKDTILTIRDERTSVDSEQTFIASYKVDRSALFNNLRSKESLRAGPEILDHHGQDSVLNIDPDARPEVGFEVYQEILKSNTEIDNSELFMRGYKQPHLVVIHIKCNEEGDPIEVQVTNSMGKLLDQQLIDLVKGAGSWHVKPNHIIRHSLAVPTQ